jgi:hypothetical protein
VDHSKRCIRSGTYKEGQQVAVAKFKLTKQDLENKDQLKQLLLTFHKEFEIVRYTSNLFILFVFVEISFSAQFIEFFFVN